MRYLLLIIFYSTFWNTINHAQNFQSKDFKEIDKDLYIKEIRTEFSKITNSINSYKLDSYELVCQYSWGSADYYYKADELKCIKVDESIENGTYKIEYYYNENKLFFIFSVWDYYIPLGYDEETQSHKTSHIYEEKRYYLYNEELFRCLIKVVDCSEVENEKAKSEAQKEEVSCDPNNFDFRTLEKIKKCKETDNFKSCYCGEE